MSPFKDISYLLEQIKNDEKKNEGKNAYIVIKPSRIAWDIAVEWR